MEGRKSSCRGWIGSCRERRDGEEGREAVKRWTESRREKETEEMKRKKE